MGIVTRLSSAVKFQVVSYLAIVTSTPSSEHFLSTYCVPGMMFGAGGVLVRKTRQESHPHGTCVLANAEDER